MDPHMKENHVAALANHTAETVHSFLGKEGDVIRFRNLITDHRTLELLHCMLPKIDGQQLAKIAEKIERSEPLRRRERLLVALVHLALDYSNPKDGDEAFRQIVQVLMDVEKTHLHDETVRQWYREIGGNPEKGRGNLVEEAFEVYKTDDPESSYDENAHPAAFSEVLKPPAQRYNRKNLFEGKDVITQLNHITIIDRNTGAVEIQEIDPSLSARLSKLGDPLILAILDDQEYFRALPHKSHLVIYRKPGLDGQEVWSREMNPVLILAQQ